MRRSFSIITIWIALFLQFAVIAARPVQAGLAGRAAQLVASPTPQIIMPVVTVTPMPDGSMVHEVQPGQSLWAIAIAYGVKIADLVALNSQLSSANPVIYVGEKIVVRGTSLPSVSPTITETPFPVSSTPTITRTPRPPTRTPAASLTYTTTVQPAASLPDLPAFESANRRVLGIGLVAICVVGLLAVVIGSFRKK